MIASASPTLGQLFRAFLRLGTTAFGGPTMVAYIRRLAVERRVWLTADEFDIMKTHPERGAKIMGRIPQMKNTVPGMRFHHERWSGGGYPDGFRGE